MKTERGFTLVELMVTISIMAILSVVGLVVYSSTQKIARDGKRREDLKAISVALEQYKLVNKAYPPAGFPNWCTIIPATVLGGNVSTSLAPYFTGGLVPTDPTYSGNPGDYWYIKYTIDGVSYYELGSTLEQPGSLPQVTFRFQGVGVCAYWTDSVKYYLKITNPK